MEKLHIHNKLSLFYLLQLISLLLFSSAYSPSVKHFINCGSNSSINITGRTFVGDINSNSSLSVAEGDAIFNPLPDTSPLYRTARVYTHQSQYELNITKRGTYIVRLHFFAFKSQRINLSDALFDVTTSNISLLSNFKVQNNFPMIKEFFLTINVTKIEIQFSPSSHSSFAFINAIEVFILPQNFIPEKALVVPLVTSKEDGSYYDLLSEVLQTIYRINVGGPKIADANDSLWSNWMQDDGFLISASPATTCKSYSGELGEGPRSIEEIAPAIVYRTCREVMGKSEELSLPNITWSFNVTKNARFFIRAHFRNIIGAFLDFNLYFYTSPIKIEPFNYSNFWDFVVDSDDSGYLKVSVSPDKDYLNKVAYLNGIEVMEFVKKKSFSTGAYAQPNKSLVFIIIGSVGGVVLVSAMMMLFLFRWRWRRANLVKDSVLNNPAFSVTNLNLNLKISFAEILAATNSFDRRLLIGEGGFGKVYKGRLRNGRKVAVKRSSSGNGQGVPEFQTEVIVLSQIQHRHLVSLIGYCTEGAEMILVYEFMEKGTLRDHLYNWKGNSACPSTQSVLTWKQRLEICICTAKGLHYLHTCSDGGIIHRDVKSTNILLDEYYVAKVADFGLSQSGLQDPDHLSMGIKGSFGYLDPEYFRTLQLTHKSDVYSFGVVLLEVLCARPPIVNSCKREEINLADWGLFWQKKGEIEKIIDPLLVGCINPYSLRKFGEIVGKCLKPEGSDRPTMLDVCWYLEYALQLQETSVHREPHEDSTTDVSSGMVFPLVQRSSSLSFPDAEGNSTIGQDDDQDTRTLLVELF